MILLLRSFPLVLYFSLAAAVCNQTCGQKSVPYPFGFSSGCPIRLNCSANYSRSFQILIGEFAVTNFTSDSLLLDVPPSCNRLIEKATALFTNSYAVTSRNNLVLGSCNKPPGSSSCPGSSIALNCTGERLSCFDGETENGFFVEKNLTGGSCSLLVSSIYMNKTGAVELDWWLEGGCDLCSDYTQCRIRFSPVTGNQSVTCKCNEGFDGDGFAAGKGCRQVSLRCSPSNYFSGKCGSSSRIGVLVGGIVAGAAIMAGVAVLCYFIRKHTAFSRRRQSTKQLLSEASCTVPLYNYKEIERATDGFSDKNRLGTGAYGMVYFGKLHNDELLAFKKLRYHDAESIDQVMNEIKLLTSVSHPNLVRLLGCCIEKGEQVLIYEYMPNGTLAQHLQRERAVVLPWTVRLNIAIETAKAIAHLHFAVHPPIYHRDIKSSNILLDYNFSSKVADFGLSRMIMTESSHVSTAPQGTPGYVDPQYHQNFHLSDKSDVYSFGVVLVEIITAKKVVDFSRRQSEVNLAALAIGKIGKGCLEEILDPFLEHNRDAWTLSSIYKVAELAFRCLAFHRDMRPSMMEVADELEQIRVSGWAPSDDNIVLSSTSSLRSTPSNITDKLRATIESRRLTCLSSMDGVKGESPVSVQDPWRSEQSSSSANSLLGKVVK